MQTQFQLPPQMQRIKQMYKMLQNAKNPQGIMQQIIAQNPMMNQLQQIVNQYGGNPKDAFYKMAQEKGIDPNAILNALK